jgi:hypothetical protein
MQARDIVHAQVNKTAQRAWDTSIMKELEHVLSTLSINSFSGNHALSASQKAKHSYGGTRLIALSGLCKPTA